MRTQCPGQDSNGGLLHLLAGCSSDSLNVPSVSALSLALFSRSTRNGSPLEKPSPERFFILLVLAV